jgi:hypothetical protein
MKFKFKTVLLTVGAGAVLATIFTMCKASDLRTSSLKKQGVTAENEAMGRKIMQDALDSMHYENWAKHAVYEVVGSDHWQKPMGLNISPWQGENGSKLRMTYATNSFDSRVEWLEGSMKGQVKGIQSWRLYTQNPDGKVVELNADKRLSFILPTMQYFNEILYRLSNAPIVAFAGEKEVNGKMYDLVFCTWGSAAPNKHDQYLLYIHRQTRRMERVSYTIRDNYMFTPANFYGTGVYSDFRQVDGVSIPFLLEIFPFEQTHKKAVHRFQIQEFRFDSHPVEYLYPLEHLVKMGDSKF